MVELLPLANSSSTTPTARPTGKTISFKPVVTSRELQRSLQPRDRLPGQLLLRASGYANPEAEADYGKKYDSEGHVLSRLRRQLHHRRSASTSRHNHVFTLESKPFEGGYAPVVIEYDENGEAITSFGDPGPRPFVPGPRIAEARWPSGRRPKDLRATTRVNTKGARHIEIFEKTGQATGPHGQDRAAGADADEGDAEGTVDLDGAGNATECYFQWGDLRELRRRAPCTPGSPISGRASHEVTAQLEGLTQGAQYHYRLVAKNANGILAFGLDRPFRPQGELSMSETVVSEVNSDGARISAESNPNGGETTYFVEYGQEDCDLGSCAVAPLGETFLPNVLGTQEASVVLSGLKSDTSYHYRLVAKNDFGEVPAPKTSSGPMWSNRRWTPARTRLIRKETGTVLLPDCRAYELVSPPTPAAMTCAPT